MLDIDALLAQAVPLHQAGNLDEACAIYRRIIEADPRHPYTLYSLGVAALQRGENVQAIEWFRRSLAVEPHRIDGQFYYGLARLNLNQHEQAAEAFEKTVKLDPTHGRAFCLLGNCRTALRQYREAVIAYESCLRLNAQDCEAANNLANVHKLEGRLDQAAHLYRHALSLLPDNADLLFNLSQVYHQASRFDLALPVLQRAVALKPDVADWHLQLGFALQGVGDNNGAKQEIQKSLLLNPSHAQAHYELGNLFIIDNNVEAAVVCYEEAVKHQPGYVQAMSNLGAAHQRRQNLDEAYRWYQRVLQLDPNSSNALYNIGQILYLSGKFDGAVAYLQRAHEAAPTHIETLGFYAMALTSLHQFDLAAKAMERLVELSPENADAHSTLGSVYRQQQQHDLTLGCYRRAHALDPKAPSILAGLISAQQTVCDWDGLDELSDKYVEYVEQEEKSPLDGTVAPFMIVSLSKPTTARQQLLAAQKHIRQREQCFNKALHRRRSDAELRDKNRKLRIGYFSGDLQQHPVGYLVAELFESHDRNEFEVYAYSFGPEDSSSLRRRLVASVDRFRDIHRDSFAQSAERIAKDEIDILVDLHGYTTHCRTDILLMRPAPIQVNYLGYPSTMGTKAIDYIFVDDYIVPTEQQGCFSEKLVHLPGCFLVSDSQREIETKPVSRPYLGLPEDGFVFCAFNSNSKMNRRMFDVWMRLLHAVPGSVLWLRDSNRFAVANLRREAERSGVATERLVMAPSMSMPKHLARHRAADLFLDSFPYNQHSTAADALRMGLPLVTLSGDTFVSRVAGSLLSYLGLPELITHSFEEYESRIIQLAQSPVDLSAIRRKLHQALATTDLFDGKVFARKLEAAFRKMWQNLEEFVER